MEENVKMLIEIFCQKPIVSNVILAFLDHLKTKIFFVSQPWWPTQSASPFRNLWIRPCFKCTGLSARLFSKSKIKISKLMKRLFKIFENCA